MRILNGAGWKLFYLHATFFKLIFISENTKKLLNYKNKCQQYYGE